MQKEIDRVKRKLRQERRRRSPSVFDLSSDDGQDEEYKHRSKTPPSETFSYEQDYRRERKGKGPSSKGQGNDAMSKALS